MAASETLIFNQLYASQCSEIHWLDENKQVPHRIGGPAATQPPGNKYWGEYGQLHRLDGPAIEWHDGNFSYYIKGKVFSKEEWEKEVSRYKTKQNVFYHVNKDVYIDPSTTKYKHARYSNGWELDGDQNGILVRVKKPDGTEYQVNSDGSTNDPNVQVSCFNNWGGGIGVITQNDRFKTEENTTGIVKKYLDSKLHCETGPARTGTPKPEYWLYGQHFTEQAWAKAVEALRQVKTGADATIRTIFYTDSTHQKYREDGPAIIWDKGHQIWLTDGNLTKLIMPDGRVFDNLKPAEGTPDCYENQEGAWVTLDKEDGTILLDHQGVEESIDGSKRFFREEKLHSVDGPAVIPATGEPQYFLEGKEYSKEDWEKEIEKKYIDKVSLADCYYQDLNHRIKRTISPYIIWKSGFKDWVDQNGKFIKMELPTGEIIIKGENNQFPLIRNWDASSGYAEYDVQSGIRERYFSGHLEYWWEGRPCTAEEYKERTEAPITVTHTYGDFKLEIDNSGNLLKLITPDGKITERWTKKENSWYNSDLPALVNIEEQYIQKDGVRTYFDGSKGKIYNNQLHSTDGPALTFANGKEEYYLEGKVYSKEDWEKEVLNKYSRRLGKYTLYYRSKGCITDDYRQEAPALIYDSGFKIWKSKDNLHKMETPRGEILEEGQTYPNFKVYGSHPGSPYYGGFWSIYGGIEYNVTRGLKRLSVQGEESYVWDDQPCSKKEYLQKMEELKQVKLGEGNAAYTRFYADEAHQQNRKGDSPSIIWAKGHKLWFKGPDAIKLEMADGRTFHLTLLDGKYKYDDVEFTFLENGSFLLREGDCTVDQDETKRFYLDGKLHSVDGPAVIPVSGEPKYYLLNQKYSKEEWEKEIERNYCSLLDEDSKVERRIYYKNRSRDLRRGMNLPAIIWKSGFKSFYGNTGVEIMETPDGVKIKIGASDFPRLVNPNTLSGYVLYKTSNGLNKWYFDGTKEYQLNGKSCTEQEWLTRVIPVIKDKDTICERTIYVDSNHRLVEDRPSIVWKNGAQLWVSGLDDGTAASLKVTKAIMSDGREIDPALVRMNAAFTCVTYSNSHGLKSEFLDGNKFYHWFGTDVTEAEYLKYNSELVQENDAWKLYRNINGDNILKEFKYGYYINYKDKTLKLPDGTKVNLELDSDNFYKSEQLPGVKIDLGSGEYLEETGVRKYFDGRVAQIDGGRYHSNKGPALTQPGQEPRYFLFGIEYTREEWELKTGHRVILNRGQENEEVHYFDPPGTYRIEEPAIICKSGFKIWKEYKDNKSVIVKIQDPDGNIYQDFDSVKLGRDCLEFNVFDGLKTFHFDGRKEYLWQGKPCTPEQWKDYAKIQITEYPLYYHYSIDGKGIQDYPCRVSRNGWKLWEQDGKTTKAVSPNGTVYENIGWDGNYIKLPFTTEMGLSSIRLKDSQERYWWFNRTIDKSELETYKNKCISKQGDKTIYYDSPENKSVVGIHWDNGDKIFLEGSHIRKLVMADGRTFTDFYEKNGYLYTNSDPFVELTGTPDFKLRTKNGTQTVIEKLGGAVQEWVGQTGHHREDGPAKIINGIPEYWLEGVSYRNYDAWKRAVDKLIQERQDTLQKLNWYGHQCSSQEEYAAYVKSCSFENSDSSRTHCYDSPTKQNLVKTIWKSGYQAEYQDNAGKITKAIFPDGTTYLAESNCELGIESGHLYVSKKIGNTSIWKDSLGCARYYTDNKFHREDGPAVIDPDKEPGYYLEGVKYSKEEWEKKLRYKKEGITQVNGLFIKKNEKETRYYLDYEKNILHREDGPAVIIVSFPDNECYYFWEGTEIYKEDWEQKVKEKQLAGSGATEIEPGVFQRVENQGLAHEQTVYYSDAKCTIKHRVGGPALECKCAVNEWKQNGQFHREDGPALIGAHYYGTYYLKGKTYDEANWRRALNKNNVELSPGVYHTIFNQGRADQYTEYYSDPEGKVKHRLDGPAIEYLDPAKNQYFWQGEELSVTEWEQRVNPIVLEVPVKETRAAGLPTRIALTQLNQKLDSVIPIPLARSVAQYALGYSGMVPTALSKELRVDALAHLGNDFLDQIGHHISEAFRTNPLQVEMKIEPIQSEKEIILEEIQLIDERW